MADDPRARLAASKPSRKLRSQRRPQMQSDSPMRMSLSFTEMCLNSDGAVLRREQVEELRKRQGFCPTCLGEPVRLYDIQRSRFNPLLFSKEPRNVPGESYEGNCLHCYPEKSPGGSRLKSTKSFRERRGSLSRPMADRLTSSSNNSGFGDEGESSSTSPGTSSRRLGSQNSVNGDGSASPRSMMQSVTERMDQTMTTLAEVTSGESVDQSDGENDQEKDEEEKASETRVRRRSSLASDASSLEEMYQQCREQSRNRSTRRSTLIQVDVSKIDFGDLDSDSETEQEGGGRPPLPPPRNGEHQLSRASSSDENETVQRSERQQATENPEELIESTLSELDSLVKDLTTTGNPDFAVDVLVNAMKSHPDAEAIQVFCLGTVWNFCKTNSAIKESVISSTAPEDILLAMQKHLSSALVQERGCGIIRALSGSPKNRRVLSHAGCVSRVLRALEEHNRDEHVVATAVGALRTLSPEAEVRQAYKTLDVKSVVLDAMELHRLVEAIQRDGIVFLSNTAIEVDGSQVAEASLDELDAIVQAMAAHRSNMSVKSVMSVACFALKNYSYDERNVRTLLKCNKSLRPLLEMASERSVDPSCRNDATITLERIAIADAMMSSIQDEDFRHMSSSMGDMNGVSVPELLVTIEGKDGATDNEVETAFESLLQLSRASESRRSQIAESGNLEVIVAAMKRYEGNAKIQQCACGIIEGLVEETLGVIEAGGCNAVVNVMLIHGDNVAVLIAAFNALKVLSVNFECWFELEQSGLMEPFRDSFNQHMDSDTLQKTGTDILMNFSAYSG